MKKTMVLGCEGFIGRAVYAKLREKGCPDIVLGACHSAGMRLHERFEWLYPLLRDVDTVYLCAGRTGGVGRMAQQPFAFIYPNVRIHMNVFEACANAGVRRVVCVQSTTGYPDSPLPMREDQYFEEPTHPYYFAPSVAHRFIYRLAEMHKTLEIVFFRPSNVYGPWNNFDPVISHVIEATVRKVAEHQDPFVIWGDGSEVRDAIYIDDLAEAMVLGAECPPGAYNVASGEEMDVNGIVRTLLKHEGFHPTIRHDLSKPTAIAARRVDITKARTVLGWEPRIGMQEGLIRTLEWYHEHAPELVGGPR